MNQPSRSGAGGPQTSDRRHSDKRVQLPGASLSTAERMGVGVRQDEFVVPMREGGVSALASDEQ
jgi:hypothetical protein